jgi:type IV pilus assembly protein PilW
MQVHRVIANGYYVSGTSQASVGLALVPSLRVWALQADGSMRNQELIAGVEDMQIQFGIDTDAPGSADRGSIDRFVNVNDPLVEPFNPAANAEILAVRIWLRVRAERIETGFVDTATYTYAGQVAGPFNDNFRRLVVSKTIYLRNARPIS